MKRNYVVTNATTSVARVRILRVVAMVSFLAIMLLVGLSEQEIDLEKRGFAVSGERMAKQVSGKPIAQEAKNYKAIHTVTVRYFDYDGNELCPPVTMTLEWGQTFKVVSPSLENRKPHTDVVEDAVDDQDMLYPVYYQNVQQ